MAELTELLWFAIDEPDEPFIGDYVIVTATMPGESIWPKDSGLQHVPVRVWLWATYVGQRKFTDMQGNEIPVEAWARVHLPRRVNASSASSGTPAPEPSR